MISWSSFNPNPNAIRMAFGNGHCPSSGTFKGSHPFCLRSQFPRILHGLRWLGHISGFILFSDFCRNHSESQPEEGQCHLSSLFLPLLQQSCPVSPKGEPNCHFPRALHRLQPCKAHILPHFLCLPLEHLSLSDSWGLLLCFPSRVSVHLKAKTVIQPAMLIALSIFTGTNYELPAHWFCSFFFF